MGKIKYQELTAEQYDKAVQNLAREYLVIKTCRKCGYPRVDGYCCSHCGTYNPDQTYEEEKKKPSPHIR